MCRLVGWIRSTRLVTVEASHDFLLLLPRNATMRSNLRAVRTCIISSLKMSSKVERALGIFHTGRAMYKHLVPPDMQAF